MPGNFQREHKKFERAMASIISGFFIKQIQLLNHRFSTSGFITTNVPFVFDPTKENALLLNALSNHVCKTIIKTAASEYKRLTKRNSKADEPFPLEQFLGSHDVPDEILDYLKTYVEELSAQPYWLQIQQSTSNSITKIIADGISQGLSNKQIAKSLMASLGGTSAKQRALAIARTETTGIMNASHHGVHLSLAKSGMLIGKSWNSTLDGSARETHNSLHGVTVKVGDDFDVGGAKAPFPGHYSLPARERVRCRCVTTTESIFD